MGTDKNNYLELQCLIHQLLFLGLIHHFAEPAHDEPLLYHVHTLR